MNNSFLIFFFLLFYNSQDLKVISYNIRYNNPNDGINIWENRRSTIGEFISNENPDFIGMQEVVYSQLFNLIDDLPNYSYVGVGRDDGKTKGEYSPILFSNIKYEVLKSNTFLIFVIVDFRSLAFPEIVAFTPSLAIIIVPRIFFLIKKSCSKILFFFKEVSFLNL